MFVAAHGGDPRRAALALPALLWTLRPLSRRNEARHTDWDAVKSFVTVLFAVWGLYKLLQEGKGHGWLPV